VRDADPADLRRHNEILRLYIALSSLKDVGASLKTAVGGQFDLQRSDQGFRRAPGYASGASPAPRAGCRSQDQARRSHRGLRPLVDIYENSPARPHAWPSACCGNTAGAFPSSSIRNGASRNLLIDLFVGLCVVSRADSIIKSDPAAAPR